MAVWGPILLEPNQSIELMVRLFPRHSGLEKWLSISIWRTLGTHRVSFFLEAVRTDGVLRWNLKQSLWGCAVVVRGSSEDFPWHNDSFIKPSWWVRLITYKQRRHSLRIRKASLLRIPNAGGSRQVSSVERLPTYKDENTIDLKGLSLFARTVDFGKHLLLPFAYSRESPQRGRVFSICSRCSKISEPSSANVEMNSEYTFAVVLLSFFANASNTRQTTLRSGNHERRYLADRICLSRSPHSRSVSRRVRLFSAPFPLTHSVFISYFISLFRPTCAVNSSGFNLETTAVDFIQHYLHQE